MANAKRTTITLPEEVYELARELMKLRRYTDFAGFVQQLIREEYHRRIEPLAENPIPYGAGAELKPLPEAKPTSYLKTRRTPLKKIPDRPPKT